MTDALKPRTLARAAPIAVTLSLFASVAACHRSAPDSSPTMVAPVAPSPVTTTTRAPNVPLPTTPFLVLPQDVSFPPRNEPVDFGNQLNVFYQSTLRRVAVVAFVDIEGFVVWIQEYLRYRVNACSHADAIAKVVQQINGGGVAAVCGTTPAGAVSFPGREQTVAFGNQLNVVYRDTLRRSAVATFVDLEGWIVWIQEYLRYRVNSCGHIDAIDKVFTQIRGGGVQPVCSTTTSSSSTSTSTVPPPLVANFTPPSPCRINPTQPPCQFDATASRGAVQYRWSWGDGTPSSTLSSPVTTHQYRAELLSVGGTRSLNVTLTVTAADGRTASVMKSVELSRPSTLEFQSSARSRPRPR